MVIDTNAKWAKTAVWTTMVATLVAAQSIFPRTGFHGHWSLPMWALLPPHAALFALSYTYGPLLDTRRPRLGTLKPFFPRTFSFQLSYILFLLLPTDWAPHSPLPTTHSSLLFLCLVSVYLLCLSRVVCPGGKVILPYVPLVVAARVSCHVSNEFDLLWVPFAMAVVAVGMFLEDSDREIAEDALAAERDHAAMIRLIPARHIMNL